MLFNEMGSKWAKIRKILNNGKSDHMVKNRFRFLQRKEKKLGEKEWKEIKKSEESCS